MEDSSYVHLNVEIISQRIHISKHHIVPIKYEQFLLVKSKYIKIKVPWATHNNISLLILFGSSEIFFFPPLLFLGCDPPVHIIRT